MPKQIILHLIDKNRPSVFVRTRTDLAYCIMGIICYVKLSLSSVSGTIGVAILSLFAIQIVFKLFSNNLFSFFQFLSFAHDHPLQTVHTQDAKPGCCMNTVCYWIFTLCMLPWCYRLWHKDATNRVKFTYLKLVMLGPVDILDSVTQPTSLTLPNDRTVLHRPLVAN